MAIVEEEYCQFEEARGNLTTALTSEAETSEVEDYSAEGSQPY